jgi:hypothetical protein
MPIHFQRISDTRGLFVYDGDITDREVEVAQAQWLTVMRECDVAGKRVTLLADGTRSSGMSARQRRISAEFSDRNEALLRRVCAAQAVVLVSALQRGVLTAIMWLKPPPVDLRAFKTREEAEAFLDEVERGQALSRSA